MAFLPSYLSPVHLGSSNSSAPDTSVKFNFAQSNVTLKYEAGLEFPTNLIVRNIKPGQVHYESDTKRVATVDNGGLLSIHAVGTATITVTRSTDSENPQIRTAKFLLTVIKGDQAALVFEKSKLPVGLNKRTASNVATGGTVLGEITYSIDNTSVATINKNTGELTLKNIGTAKVTATKAGNANYTTISNSYILDVNNKLNQPDLTFAQDAITLDYVANATRSNTATGGEGEGAITYRSNNKNVATVDNNGVVTVKSAGSARITATKEGDADYNPTEKSYILTVNKIAQTGFRFDQSTITLAYSKGLTTRNIAKGGQGSGKIRYKIDKTNIATVDPNSGKVTILGAGTAIITATREEDTNYKAITTNYVLVVNKGEQTGFRFVQASITIDYVQNATKSNIPTGRTKRRRGNLPN